MEGIEHYFENEKISKPTRKDFLIDLVEAGLIISIFIGYVYGLKFVQDKFAYVFNGILIISYLIIFLTLREDKIPSTLKKYIFPFTTKYSKFQTYQKIILLSTFIIDTMIQLKVPKSEISVKISSSKYATNNLANQFEYTFAGNLGVLSISASYGTSIGQNIRVVVKLASREKNTQGINWSISIRKFSASTYDNLMYKDMKAEVKQYREGVFTGKRNMLIQTQNKEFDQRYMIRLENIDDNQDTIFHNLFNMDSNLDIVLKLEEYLDEITIKSDTIETSLDFNQMTFPEIEDFVMLISFLFFGYSHNLKCTVVDVPELLNSSVEPSVKITTLPQIHYTDTSFFSRCILCFQPIRGNSGSKLSCCGITAHSNHLQSWTMYKQQCPYCKKSKFKITSIE